MRDHVPPRVTVDGEVADESLLSSWLSEKAGRRVQIAVPQRGEQAQLMEMCRSNAAEKLAEHLGRAGKQTAALDELARLLGLEAPPEYIEAYDISHTAGSDNVAGMVVFRGGVPYKQAYKRFSIKSFEGQDDYGSMNEVLTRRFTHYVEEKETGEGFGKLPDLILLDGGQGQVNAVRPVLQQFGLKVPLFGMVKDDRHRTRALVTPEGREIGIVTQQAVFSLIGQIQEETHRFAIEFNRQQRKSRVQGSALDKIPGVGEEAAHPAAESIQERESHPPSSSGGAGKGGAQEYRPGGVSVFSGGERAMRVISGTARGRRLGELEGMETRPTTDRVKEALFNIVQFEIPGGRFWIYLGAPDSWELRLCPGARPTAPLWTSAATRPPLSAAT